MKKIFLLIAFCVAAIYSKATPYCTPVFANPCSSYPMNASIGHLVGYSGFISDGTGCTTSSYEDYSASMSCTLLAGGSYGATLNLSASYYNSFQVQVWIDFNDDSTFQTTESVGGGGSFSTASPVIILTIPSTAATGAHRMRLVNNYMCCGGGTYPALNPCPTSSISYGDARDYTAVITTGAPLFTATPAYIAFAPTMVGTSSVGTGIVFNGYYLTPASGSVTVTAGGYSDFEIYDAGSSSWVNSYTISYTSGTIASVTVPVRFSPSALGAFSGNVYFSGGGASTFAVPLSGNGATACYGTPFAGLVTATPYSVCGSSSAVTLTDSGCTTDLGIAHQWQLSSDSTTWTNIAGATGTSFTITMSSSRYFRCAVNCTYSSSTAYTPGRLVTYSSTCIGLVATPATLFFPSTITGTTSATQNTVLTGSGLTPASGTVVVTAPTNFTVYDGSAWVTSYSIAYSGGAVSATTIPVRFNAPSTAGTYSGNLTIAGGGAATLNVPLNGVSAAMCSGTPAAGTASSSVAVAGAATAIMLTDAGYSATAGITFQWQSSPTGTSSWSDISGAISATYSFAGISATTYYRCIVTCAYSSASAATSAVGITYVPPCSGTPSGGTASSSTYYCSSCTDTLSVSGYSAAAGLTFQWQQSVNGTSGWVSLAMASTSPDFRFAPTGDNYYRCAVRCAASGLTGYSSSVHVVYEYRILTHSVTDSTSTVCNGPSFSITANGNSSLLYVKTYYGDGAKDSLHLVGSSTSSSTVHHVYAHSGAYSVKQIVYFNNVPQDSISFTHNYFFCRMLPIAFFVDDDANGVRGSSEHSSYIASSTEVDSSGIAIDTITATSGFYYPANGPVGTVYSFRVVSNVGGYYTSCPASGVIYDTIVATVNTYTQKYFGLACPSSTGFNLREFPTLVCGPHGAGGTIYVDNISCNTQSPVVRLEIGPKYVYYSGHPSPSSVVGNVVTWNLGSMSVNSSPVTISYRLEKPTGSADRHPGDTTHNSYFVSPTAGDVDTTNNHTDRCDTVRSSYDPNFIESTPSGHILAGTLLHYVAGFENDGNDTAHNIHVLDTLSDYLDASTFQSVWASHEMYTEMQHLGSMTIVKFDFPNIKLLDSTHHGLCEGTFAYDIKVKEGLPECTVIPARVGIYFDENEVVMTNEHRNVIGCWPAAVGSVQLAGSNFDIYPNPATDQLTIKMGESTNANMVVSNSIGTVVMQQALTASQTNLNIKNLAPGIYYVKLVGEGSRVVKRFVKL